MSKFLVPLIAVSLLVGTGFAQELDQKEVKARIVKLQREITRLKKKANQQKDKKKRIEVYKIIGGYEAEVGKLERRLKPKVPQPVQVEAPPAIPEAIEIIPEVEEKKVVEIPRRLGFEVGGVAGLFSGASALMGEARFPLHFIFGPATTLFRVSTGLAQSRDADRRYVPVNIDLVFNFPPGWFTGVENYLGAGLNYVVLTSGRVSGTIGGQLFYGVQSEGFGGVVFGEMGYGMLCTGFAASHKGTTIMVGYRKPLDK